MRKSKKVVATFMIVAMCGLVTACNTKNETPDPTATPQATELADTTETPEVTPEPVEEVKDYKNSGNTFQLSVAGEWIQSETNADNITLDNEDQSLSILVQAFPKEDMDGFMVTSFDDFIAYYKKNAIAAIVASADPINHEVNVDSSLASLAEEYIATSDEVTAKAFFVYFETEERYFTYAITGIEELYDQNIENLKNVVQTITEIKPE